MHVTSPSLEDDLSSIKTKEGSLVPNLRDFGSIDTKKLRKGMLYRSSGLFDEITLKELKINSIIDLRTEDDPVVPEFDRGKILHVPLLSSGAAADLFSSMPWYRKLRLMCCFSHADRIFSKQINRSPYHTADFYMMILEHTPDEVKDIMEFLADESNYPVILHCAVGKDRTGIIIAIILALCEIEKSKIVADYAVSERNLSIAAESGLLGNRKFIKKYHIMSPAETMEHMLDMIEEIYGSLGEYFEEIGVNDETLEKVKHNLLVANEPNE